MKTINFLSVLTAAALVTGSAVFAGCKKSPEPEPEALTVSTKTPAFSDGSAGFVTFDITSNASWIVTLVTGGTWCSIDPEGNGKGNRTVKITASAENATGQEQTAAITVSGAGKTETINVTRPSKTVGVSSKNAAFSSGDAAVQTTFDIISDTSWSLEVTDGKSWCTALPASGTGNQTITLTALTANNTTGKIRDAKVVIAGAGKTETVAVAQPSVKMELTGTYVYSGHYMGQTIVRNITTTLGTPDKAEITTNTLPVSGWGGVNVTTTTISTYSYPGADGSTKAGRLVVRFTKGDESVDCEMDLYTNVSVGDLFYDYGSNTPVGVIAKAKPSASAFGLIVHKDEKGNTAWANAPYLTTTMGTVNQDDGAANQDVIRKSNKMSYFPPFQWCSDKGSTEWFLPAVNELRTIIANVTLVNAGLSRIGGTTISYPYYYWSSTEDVTVPGPHAQVSSSTGSDGYSSAAKDGDYKTRACRHF